MKRLGAILPLVLLGACARAPDPATAHFLAQMHSDPELRIEDAYKWLFHATRGGEHALVNEGAARQWLDHEWATLGPAPPGEPLWVPLTADGRIGRLNLRPYREHGGDRAALHDAFVAGAASFDARPIGFQKAWRAFGRALKGAPAGHLTRAAWEQFDRQMRAQRYPACHHSAEYQQARQPAYRVLPAAEARRLLEALPPPRPDIMPPGTGT